MSDKGSPTLIFWFLVNLGYFSRKINFSDSVSTGLANACRFAAMQPWPLLLKKAGRLEGELDVRRISAHDLTSSIFLARALVGGATQLSKDRSIKGMYNLIIVKGFFSSP